MTCDPESSALDLADEFREAGNLLAQAVEKAIPGIQGQPCRCRIGKPCELHQGGRDVAGFLIEALRRYRESS